MANDDWYRNRTWDPDTEAAFDRRIARARSPWTRWQYLQIQAGCLTYAVPRLLEPALALHRRALEVRGIAPDWATVTWHDLGQILLRLGRLDEAEDALRSAVTASAPAERELIGGSVSPEERLARLLLFRQGHAAEAEARTLLAAVGRRRVPDYEALVSTLVRDSDPESAAEAFVVAIHVSDLLDDAGVDAVLAATPAALREIDALHLRDLPTSASYLAQEYIPGLGAWLGRVLVRSYGASWAPGPSLWGGRVVLPDGRAIDPFLAAYDAVYVGVPLAGATPSPPAP